jgi:RNA polymerase primary sigma factor
VYDYLASQRIHVTGHKRKEAEIMEEEKAPAEDDEMAAPVVKDKLYDLYMQELAEIQPALPGEEEALYEKAVQGDDLAKSRLVEIHLSTVVEIAKQYQNARILASELIQEGNIGLLLGIDTLQNRDNALSPKAHIESEIHELMRSALKEDELIMRAGEQVAERANYLHHAVKNLEEDLERKVTIEELSAYLEMSVEEIEEIIGMTGGEIDVEGYDHKHE